MPTPRSFALLVMSLWLGACVGFYGIERRSTGDSDRDVEGEVDGDGDADTDSDIDADGDADTDSDTDVDSDADPDVADSDLDVPETDSGVADTDPDIADADRDVSDADTGTPPLVVDLLFVIDNSNTMADVQVMLAEFGSSMIQELISPSEYPPGSGRRPPAVEDLHVGVVSTDLGAGGHFHSTCRSASGDDGVLQNIGRRPGCSEGYSALDCRRVSCPWLSHSTERPDDETSETEPIWDDFSCIVALGASGCGFEQPLEAMDLALVDRSRPRQPNSGFLRDDSILGLVFLTDEDDCSAINPTLFFTEEGDFSANVRCVMQPEQLHSVTDYVSTIRDMRPNPPNRVFVAVIAGVPTDGSWSVGDPVSDLADLIEVTDGEMATSCESWTGQAFPPVRMVELAYGFDDHGFIGSICSSDFWENPLEDFTRAIQTMLAGD